MPKIKTSIRTEEFIQLSQQASVMGEKNDCSVKAVALAAGVSYEEAHAALAEEGRKNGKGAYTQGILRAVERCGKKHQRIPLDMIIQLYPKGHRDVLKSVTTHHPARFPDAWQDGNTYVMFTKRHVCTIINGVNHDWTNGRAMRAISVYRITNKEPNHV